MKGFHPNVSTVAALSALALSLAAGCRNPSSGSANPFLAPDRVPPPATRALAPGQAQPYYPGDPLPVMQSQAAPPAEPEMPSADTVLSWTAPGNRAAAPSATNNVPAPEPSPAVQTNEPSVAVMADQDPLRFTPQAPEPQQFQPVAPTAMVATQTPTQPTVSQAAPTPQAVVPASFNAPANQSATTPTNSPWQTPQIAAAQPAAPTQAPSFGPSVPPPPGAALSPGATPYYWPTVAPAPVAPNPMDVTLRAVPSPPMEAAPAIPRIRMPGYYDSSVPAVSSNDGFRPRSSMR